MHSVYCRGETLRFKNIGVIFLMFVLMLFLTSLGVMSPFAKTTITQVGSLGCGILVLILLNEIEIERLEEEIEKGKS